MAGGQPSQAGLIAAVTKARASQKMKGNPTSTKVKRWEKKVHRVSPGDVVYFHSGYNHATGSVGTVVGYLSKHEVLIKTFGGQDTDYPPMYVSVSNRKPNSNHTHPQNNRSGAVLRNYGMYITKVVHRISPKPSKKRTPIRFYEVDRTVLPEVLKGDHEVPDGHKVVLVDEKKGGSNDTSDSASETA